MKFWSFLLIISKMFLQFPHRHILLLEQCDVLFEFLFWHIPPFEFLEFGDSSFLILFHHPCRIAGNDYVAVHLRFNDLKSSNQGMNLFMM